MSGKRDDLGVQLDAAELGPAQDLGRLSRDRAGSRSVIAFEYSAQWLARRKAFEIDPELHLHPEEQHVRGGTLAGIFSDAAPDRWGRLLLERREAHAALAEKRRPRRLDEWEFLIGIPDAVRMGALRLVHADGRMLDDRPLDIPPVVRLRELEHAAQEFERGSTDLSEELRALSVLIAPGSSLGGGRPKANFATEDGTLWIAKFPSRDDRHDVGAWEFLLNRLAPRCGIAVPQVDLLHLAGRYRTFTTRRFDREGAKRRLFASAMTLTLKRDGEKASYLDIAEAVSRYGDPTSIKGDLEQLFRRIVFNVLVGNRDDHLRNHGFLRGPGGWRLSPAFDLNPASEKSEHALALDDTVSLPELSVPLETAPLYDLSATRAQAVVAEVRAGLSAWREEAKAIELEREEIVLLGGMLP